MFERVEISCDAVTDRNLMGCEIPRIKLHSKNYTVKLYLLNKSPQLKSLSHNLCHFSGHEQTRSFLLLYSQKWKATSIRKCLPVFFSQLCRPNAIVGFFSRFIRLSAPMFNDIIVLGCIMCLSTIYLFGIRKVNDGNRTMPRICKVRSNVKFMWLSTSQTLSYFFSGSCVAFEHRILLGFWSHVYQNLASLQDLHKHTYASRCKCIKF